MYIVHLTRTVPNFNKTMPIGYGDEIAIEENSLRIVADTYKQLKHGRVKFYLNSEIVAEINSEFIIAIIDEG